MVPKALVAALFITLGFAGCAENAPAENVIEGSTEGFELQAGKGAIAGLLIDDRFRPIHLVDDAESEFQAEGFILLQETGQQVQTDENGQFGFIDLEPGRYTLRAQIDGHEAKPTRIEVTEGIFEEASINARRTIIQTGAIITQHYAAFMDCGIFFVALSANPGCIPDNSGDTDRFDFFVDYSEYDNVTWVVFETLFSNAPKNGEQLDVVVREGLGFDYVGGGITEGKYLKLHLVNGETTPDPPQPGSEVNPWFNEGQMQMAIFGRGAASNEIREAYAPVYETATKDLPSPANASMRRGAGVMLGVKATFLNSVFIGEPEIDPLNDYCQLCPS